MLWIKKVILENFQSHEYTSLEFKEGLNTIVGATDSGKTAIFRGIKWAIYNEPQGDFFMREGADQVSVQIEFSNGVIIKRYRNKRQNGYELKLEGEEIQVFEGFGRTIPEEISQAINMSKIDFTPSENRSINMAEQLDGPFLLSESSSVKAAAIGKLVEADVIDLALKDTNTDLRNKKSKLQALKDEEENIEESLKDFDYLDELKNKIEKLDSIQIKINKKNEELEKSQRIYERDLKNTEKEKFYSQYLDQLKNLEKTEKIEFQLDKFIFRQKNLEKIYKKYRANQIKILNIKKINESLSKIDQVDLNFQTLENLIIKKGKLQKISQSSKKLAEREKILDKNLKALAKIGETEKNLDGLIIMYTRIKTLEKISLDIEEHEVRIKNGKAYLENYEELEKSDKTSSMIEEKLGQYKKLIGLEKSLASNRKKTYQEEAIRKKGQDTLNSRLEDYRKVLEKYQICPTCYRKIDEKNTEDILKHIME